MKKITAVLFILLLIAGVASAVTYKFRVLEPFRVSASLSASYVTWEFYREWTDEGFKHYYESEALYFTGVGYADQFDNPLTIHQGYHVVFPGGWFQDYAGGWHYNPPHDFFMTKGDSPSEIIRFPNTNYTLKVQWGVGGEDYTITYHKPVFQQEQ